MPWNLKLFGSQISAQKFWILEFQVKGTQTVVRFLFVWLVLIFCTGDGNQNLKLAMQVLMLLS